MFNPVSSHRPIIAFTFGGLVLSLSACSVPQAPSRGVSPSASIGDHEAKFIDVNGARTRYYDVGSGEVILLVHGARPSGTSSANTSLRKLALRTAPWAAFKRSR